VENYVSQCVHVFRTECLILAKRYSWLPWACDVAFFLKGVVPPNWHEKFYLRRSKNSTMRAFGVTVLVGLCILMNVKL
jgi:hypothetical protein